MHQLKHQLAEFLITQDILKRVGFFPYDQEDQFIGTMVIFHCRIKADWVRGGSTESLTVNSQLHLREF